MSEQTASKPAIGMSILAKLCVVLRLVVESSSLTPYDVPQQPFLFVYFSTFFSRLGNSSLVPPADAAAKADGWAEFSLSYSI